MPYIQYVSIPILLIAFFLTSCGGKGSGHPCDVYEDALNGTFSMEGLVGTMKFEGGLRGYVTAEGVDYNDMDHTDCFTTRCESGNLARSPSCLPRLFRIVAGSSQETTSTNTSQTIKRGAPPKPMKTTTAP